MRARHCVCVCVCTCQLCCSGRWLVHYAVCVSCLQSLCYRSAELLAPAPLPHLGSPGSCYSVSPLPLKDGGRAGGSGGSNAGHKEKRKKSLLPLCVNGNPRDTTCFFFVIFKSTKLFLSLSEGKNSCRVQQHIHDINEKDEMPPRCWCTVIMSRAPTGRATTKTTIYK